MEDDEPPTHTKTFHQGVMKAHEAMQGYHKTKADVIAQHAKEFGWSNPGKGDKEAMKESSKALRAQDTKERLETVGARHAHYEAAEAVTDPDHTLANEKPMDVVLEFSNEFKVLPNADDPQSNWIQISPYGDFPHSEGLQRFTKNDAQVIVNEFNGPGSIIKRTLGMGIPFYIGHPDHDKFKARYTDTKAYGRIKALDAREDGLWGNVKWSTAGKQMVNEEQFHGHSVNWAVKMQKDGAYHPVRIKSVGFTNEPNIPVLPITHANEKVSDEIENDLQPCAA